MPNGNVPPELMQLMQGSQQPGNQPNAAPVSSPMSTPQKNLGEQRAAMSQIQMAMDLLEQTLPAFGSESEEGGAVLDALRNLSKKFGSSREKGRALVPSEIMNLVASLPKGATAGGTPQMPPQIQQLMAQMQAGGAGGAPGMKPPM